MMKKLLILPIFALAACGEQRGVHEDWATGAHFGPSHKVEFQARASRGEPGVFPAPSGYSVYTAEQRAASGAADASSVPRTGTASSRTGEFITNGGAATAGATKGGARVQTASLPSGGLSANPSSLPAASDAPIVTRQQAVQQATSQPQTFWISETSQITLTRINGGRVVEKYLYVSKNGKFFTKQTTIYSPNAKTVSWIGWSDLPPS